MSNTCQWDAVLGQHSGWLEATGLGTAKSISLRGSTTKKLTLLHSTHRPDVRYPPVSAAETGSLERSKHPTAMLPLSVKPRMRDVVSARLRITHMEKGLTTTKVVCTQQSGQMMPSPSGSFLVNRSPRTSLAVLLIQRPGPSLLLVSAHRLAISSPCSTSKRLYSTQLSAATGLVMYGVVVVALLKRRPAMLTSRIIQALSQMPSGR